MSTKGKDAVIAILLLALCILACKASRNRNVNVSGSGNTNTNSAKSTAPPTTPNADGTLPSGTGVEKEKPAAGKGNVQGKVFYNEQPVADIEVKLCTTFNQYFGGCGGETFITRTDSNGEYLIRNVPPRIYEGLLVKVFKTNYYVFATSGIVQTARYKIEENQTFFAPDSNLFKQDLKLLVPKAGSKTGPSNIEVKWDSYPDAAYYKLSIFAETSSGAKPEYDFIGRRVDGQSFLLDKPLTPGAYTVKVEAYNSNEIKLSQSADDIKFTVLGEATK